VYDRVGVYNKHYLLAMDYDFYVRAMKHSVRFHYLNEDVAFFQASGRSSMAPLSCHKEVLRSQRDNGLLMPLCFTTYGLKILINRLKSLF
jgi:hypothetical protein